MAVRGVWVPVFPAMQNFGATVVQEASGAARRGSSAMQSEFRRGGQAAGQAAGRATAAGLQAQQGQIERVSRQLAGARSAEADAAGAVRVAEAKLADVRGNANSTAAQIAAAEEAANKARRTHETRVSALSTAEQQLEQIRSGAEGTSRTVIRAEQQLAAARNKVDDANGQIRVAETKLNELRSSGTATSQQIAQAEERLARAERQRAGAADEVSTSQLRLANAQAQAQQSTEENTDAVEDQERKFGISMETAAKWGAAVESAAVAVGTALFKVGSQFDDMGDALRLTGANGAQLDALNQSAMNVAQTTPALDGGLEQIGQTMATLHQRLGLTGQPLENLTSQMVQLANMGQEVDLNEVTGAMTAFGIKGEDTSATLDNLFQVSQRTGLTISELATSVSKGGPALRQFGLGIGESAALIGTLDRAGLDADKTMAAMTKGLSVFAKEGKKPKEALMETITGIKDFVSAGNDPQAIAMASKIFGTKGAAQFVDAVKSGAVSVESLNAAMAGGGDTILGAADDTADFAEQWQLFKQKALVAIEPLATRVFGVISQGMGWIADKGIPTISTVTDFIGKFKWAFVGLAAAIGTFVLPALIQYTIAQARAAASSVAASIARVAGAWRTMGVALKSTAIAQWAMNSAVLANPITWIVVALVAAGVALWAFFTKTETGRKWWAAIWGGIKAAVSGVVNWFTQTAWPFMQGVFQKIGDIAMWLWHNAISPAFNGIKTAIGFVIDHWKLFAGLLLVFTGPVGIVIGILGFLQAKFGFVTGAIRLVGTVISWLWNNIAVPAFNGIKAVIGFWWAGVQIYFNAFRAVLGGVGAVIGWLWNNVAVPAFNGIKAVIDLFWSGASITFGLIKQGIGWIGDKVVEVKDMAVNGFNAMVDFVKGLPGRIANAAKGMWDGFKDAFKAALNWIIDGWNKLQFKLPEIDTHIPGVGKIGGQTIGVPQIPRLATGGVAGVDPRGLIHGPGNGTDDYVLGIDPRTMMATAFVSNGEGVVKEKVMAAGGAAVVAGLNSGQLDPRMFSGLPRYADGGTVGTKKTPEEINKFPREQGLEGSPYNWGGVHWGDCSGTQSAIARFAVGLDPWGGRFATGNEGDALTGFGFKMGQGPAGSLRIGWKNGGEAGGHTAGTLPDNTNVEMGGGRGNGQVGGGAAAWNDSYFDTFAYLEVEPLKSYSETNPYQTQTPGADTIPTAPNIDGSNTDSNTNGSTNTGDSDKLPTMGELAGKAATEQFDDFADFLGFKDTWLYDPNKLGISTGKDKAKESTESNPNSGKSTSTSTPGSENSPTTKPKEGADKVQQAPSPAPGANQSTVPPSTTQPPKTDKEMVQAQFQPYGWSSGQPWADVDWIVGKESGWKKDAKNPSSGAYGFFQFLGSTRQAYLPEAEPVAADIQGRAGAKYIKDRCKDPAGARAHWEANNWYDRGGVGIGTGLMAKNVLEPERVLSGRQTSAFEDMVEANFSPRVSNGSDVKVAVPVLGADDDSTTGKRGGRGDAPLVGTLQVQAIDVDDQVRRINRTLRDVAKSDTILGGWG